MSKLKLILGYAAITVFILALIGFSVWLFSYRLHDCKKVGHTSLYCWTGGK